MAALVTWAPWLWCKDTRVHRGLETGVGWSTWACMLLMGWWVLFRGTAMSLKQDFCYIKKKFFKQKKKKVWQLHPRELVWRRHRVKQHASGVGIWTQLYLNNSKKKMIKKKKEWGSGHTVGEIQETPWTWRNGDQRLPRLQIIPRYRIRVWLHRIMSIWGS